MTLDEAILHAEERAAELGCSERAKEHKELAAWLKELKWYRERERDMLYVGVRA